VGDVNIDGTVNVIDVLLLKKYVLGVYDISSLPVFELKEDDSSSTSTSTTNDELELLKDTSLPSSIYYPEQELYYDYVSKQIADINSDGHLEMAVKYTNTDELFSYQIHTVWRFYTVDDYGNVSVCDNFVALGGSYPTAGTWYDESTGEYKFVKYQWKMGSYVCVLDFDSWDFYDMVGSEYYQYDPFGNGVEYGDDFTYTIDGVIVTPTYFDSYMRNIYENIVDNDRGCYYLHDGVIEIV
jgi:hypothetical protein